jgi:hypothetical protein
MSEAGKKKRLERGIKRAKRAMLVPYEKMSPHDQKNWDRGSARLMLALRGRRVPDLDK